MKEENSFALFFVCRWKGIGRNNQTPIGIETEFFKITYPTTRWMGVVTEGELFHTQGKNPLRFQLLAGATVIVFVSVG